MQWRTEEIAAYIPGYQGLTGICVVHCKETNEFILNIYNEDPETRCGGFVLLPGRIGKISGLTLAMLCTVHNENYQCFRE